MFCHDYSRRAFLQGGAAVFAGALAPRIASAAQARDPRLLTIVLRGALDGLSIVAPAGDPAYASVRGDMGILKDGPQAGLPLDGFFLLNPRMPNLARLYAKGEALIVHAAATPYRERSHFDGQDVLESGMVRPGYQRSGWMNRLIGTLPEARRAGQTLGFAAGAQVPLIMRGEAPVLSWMPPGFPSAPPDTKLRLLDLYRHTDPVLASVLEAGLGLDYRTGGEAGLSASAPAINTEGLKKAGLVRDASAAAAVAGKLMATDDGPRIGVLDLHGFDTHANQKPVEGALGNLLAGLDLIINGLAQALAPVWSDTVLAFMTEFGRTVRVNGTSGTDHGTATVALLVGGAVRGGRVLADWPGLEASQLHEGRDLRPTTDLRAVLKGVAAEHLGVPRKVLDNGIFPESRDTAPLEGLVG